MYVKLVPRFALQGDAVLLTGFDSIIELQMEMLEENLDTVCGSAICIGLLGAFLLRFPFSFESSQLIAQQSRDTRQNLLV
jgi:hypothetical protein